MSWDNITGQARYTNAPDGLPLFKTVWIDSHPCLQYVAKGPLPRVYAVRGDTRDPAPTSTTLEEIWHNRLGHPSESTVQQFAEATTGIKLKGAPMTTCEICATGKAKRQISREPSQLPAPARPYGAVSIDVFSFPLAYNGASKILLATDLYSGMIHGACVTEDAALPTTLLSIMNLAEVKYGQRMAVLRCDNDTHLLPVWFKDQLIALGTEIIASSPSQQWQNGHAERSGGVLKEKMTLLRIQSGYREDFWPLMAQAAIYLLNRTPRQKLEWRSPHEVFYSWLRDNAPKLWGHLPADLRPNLRHLRAFGCKAFPMTRDRLRGKASKIEQRAHIGYLAGYVSTTQYVVWVPSMQKHAFLNTACVTFDESTFFRDDGHLQPKASLAEEVRYIQLVEDEPEASFESDFGTSLTHRGTSTRAIKARFRP